MLWYSYDSDMIGKPMTSPIISAGFQRMYDDLNSPAYFRSVPVSGRQKTQKPVIDRPKEVKP